MVGRDDGEEVFWGQGGAVVDFVGGAEEGEAFGGDLFRDEDFDFGLL